MTDTTSAMRDLTSAMRDLIARLRDYLIAEGNAPWKLRLEAANALEALTAPAQADIHATTDDELRDDIQIAVQEGLDGVRFPDMFDVERTEIVNGIVSNVLAAINDHSPTPPRVDEKEMRLETRPRDVECPVCNAAAGRDCKYIGEAEHNGWVHVARVGVWRALTEKCK